MIDSEVHTHYLEAAMGVADLFMSIRYRIMPDISKQRTGVTDIRYVLLDVDHCQFRITHHIYFREVKWVEENDLGLLSAHHINVPVFVFNVDRNK